LDVHIDICDILCCPFTTDRTDLTGNHTIAPGNSTIVPGSSITAYNGEACLRLNQSAGGAVRTNASEPAHAIGGTDPVTFGFFLRPTFWNTTSQFVTSAAVGSGDANYGLLRFVNGDWGFRGATGGGLGSAWIIMINRSPEDSTTSLAHAGRWSHVAMRCDDGSNSGSFFWDGHEIWSGAFGTNGRHIATGSDIFGLNEANSASDNPGWTGYMNNLFIASRALSNVEIKALSDEAHGHSSPWTFGAPVL
jgi:hypothetical protein